MKYACGTAMAAQQSQTACRRSIKTQERRENQKDTAVNNNNELPGGQYKQSLHSIVDDFLQHKTCPCLVHLRACQLACESVEHLDDISLQMQTISQLAFFAFSGTGSIVVEVTFEHICPYSISGF